MTKFTKLSVLAVSALALCVPARAQIKPTAVIEMNVVDIAYDNGRDEKPYLASYKQVGNDAEIMIFGDDLEIVKSFTLKGAFQNGSEVEDIWSENIDCADILATKGVFSEDDKWCVIVKKPAANGVNTYNVVNEDNVVVCELPKNGDGDTGNFYFSRAFDGAMLYYVTSTEVAYDSSVYTFWKFTGDTGINAPSAMKPGSLLAYPNPLPAGRQLTIELNRTADTGTLVMFTDMNGRQVARRKVPEGAQTVVIDSRMLRHGMLVYTVVYGDGEVASGKVCAE